MTQCTTMAAPEPPSTIEPDALATSLAVDDPSVVLALIAEVDAIFCAAETPVCQQPTPPVVGRALRGPRRAGRSFHPVSPRPPSEPVWRLDPMQRSPPPRGRNRSNSTSRNRMTSSAWKRGDGITTVAGPARHLGHTWRCPYARTRQRPTEAPLPMAGAPPPEPPTAALPGQDAPTDPTPISAIHNSAEEQHPAMGKTRALARCLMPAGWQPGHR
jgi:hypothetical protein